MKKTIFMGLFLAYALILSYVESLIPFGFGIPGMKLGLPNLAILLCLYYYGAMEGFTINMLRIILAGFLFGNLYTILYSIAGGVLSFMVMYIMKHNKRFGLKGISVAGGVTHNIGQILVAVFIVKTAGVFFYLPFLILAGTLTGFAIGFIAQITVPYLKKIAPV